MGKVRLQIPFVYTAGVGLQRASDLDQSTVVTGTFDLRAERDGHTGSSAFSAELSPGSVELDGISCSVRIGRLGVAAIVADFPLPALDDLWECERRLLAAIDGGADAIGEEILRRVDLDSTAVHIGSPLWTHRLLIDHAGADEVVALGYATEGTIGAGVRLAIGDGVSSLEREEPGLVDAVTSGLFAASQAWIVYEDCSVTSTELLEMIREDAHDLAAAGIDEHSTSLALRARQMSAFVRHQNNGLVDGTKVAYQMAAAQWGLQGELDQLIERTDSYVSYAQLRSSALRERVDRRRNLLLFGLSFLSLASAIAAAYDFLTTASTTVGPSPRPVLFAIVTVVGVGGLFLGIVFAARDYFHR